MKCLKQIAVIILLSLPLAAAAQVETHEPGEESSVENGTANIYSRDTVSTSETTIPEGVVSSEIPPVDTTNVPQAAQDEAFEDKVGPAGQTVYIDSSSNYYYVDENGGKVYISVLQLKDKK